MKFQRMVRYEPVAWTERKLDAFLTRDRRQRRKIDAAYPLLGAALLAAPAPTPDPDAELAARQAASTRSEMSMRELTAKHWRHGRAQYFACTPESRADIRRAWEAWTGPRTPGMFIYVVEQHTGEAERRRQHFRAEDVAIKQRIIAAATTQGELEL